MNHRGRSHPKTHLGSVSSFKIGSHVKPLFTQKVGALSFVHKQRFHMGANAEGEDTIPLRAGITGKVPRDCK